MKIEENSHLYHLAFSFIIAKEAKRKGGFYGKKSVGIRDDGFYSTFMMSPVLADYVTVPATAFKSGSSSYDALWPSTGEYVYLSGSGGGNLHAPVYLPDSVTIKNMRVVYVDNHVDHNFIVSLKRQNVFTPGSIDTLFQFNSSGADSIVQYGIDNTTPINSYRKVQNGPVTWFISVIFQESTTSLHIYSIQIDYE